MPALDSRATPATPLDLNEARRGLATKRLGVKFHYFVETDSTNTQARRLAETGAAEGEVVVAEAQSQGRGRLGRVWESPPFANLYLSILLRPNLLPANAPQITLMAAVALADNV
jgi:BirA family biotin operon repressor/biotin-[acetyl-CoA-carboxylase] ligase